MKEICSTLRNYDEFPAMYVYFLTWRQGFKIRYLQDNFGILLWFDLWSSETVTQPSINIDSVHVDANRDQGTSQSWREADQGTSQPWREADRTLTSVLNRLGNILERRTPVSKFIEGKIIIDLFDHFIETYIKRDG